jgi:hypothetical protein
MKNLTAILALALVFGMTGTAAFAQEKHQPSDVLIGLNWGMGITPNIGDVFSIKDDKIPQGNYALVFDFGLTGDFYLLNWLSINTGLLLHPDLYVLLDQDFNTDKSFTDIAASPLCLTIPIMAHINVPKAEWLYTGIGLNFNIPIVGMLDSVADIDTKGKSFIGLPIDLGFDFIKSGSGGMRFFFRVTPEFHKHGTAVPVGFIWQIWNWKVKNNSSSGAENTARADVKTEKAEKPVKQAEAEKKPADAKAASAAVEADNAKRRAALDAYNAAKSKFEKAEANKTEAEARLAAAKEAVSLAEAELAKAAAALSALESR